MKYITTIHQYGWNYVLSSFEGNNIELKSNSFENKVYEHKDEVLFIFGNKGKYNRSSEWFKNNMENIIFKTKKQKILKCNNGIFSIIPKSMYNTNNVLKYIKNCTGFNHDYYQNTYSTSAFQSFVGALAYNPNNKYFGFFDFGLVKNIGRPSDLRILKCSEIGGYCIIYD